MNLIKLQNVIDVIFTFEIFNEISSLIPKVKALGRHLPLHSNVKLVGNNRQEQNALAYLASLSVPKIFFS
jgi:hypothetical protein